MFSAIATYLAQNTGTYLTAVWQHIAISLVSVICAAAIGVPLGIVCVRWAPLYKFVTGVFNTLRILPSLAVLVLCIPLLGVGAMPAVVALVVLAIPPILINTALAFKTLPADTLEAARGMGMANRSIFWQVKLPLAAPLILTGLRTATVEVIASATLAAYIGAGGLGTLIFTGLGLFRTDLLLVGGLSVAVLSLLSTFAWSGLEKYTGRHLAPKKR